MLRDESNCDGGSIVEKLESFVQGKVSESFASGLGFFFDLVFQLQVPTTWYGRKLLNKMYCYLTF